MSEQVLLVEISDNIATVTLNRPAVMNALSPQLLSELCAAFDSLQADPEVRAVVLTGNGRAFCAGLDLKAMAAQPDGAQSFDIHGKNNIGRAMGDFDRPIIVAVNGVAATGGFELALMGDILIASEYARFADTHCRVGLAPGWGLSQKLARIIGPSRAKEAHFTGNFISAEDAAQWGMISRVVAADSLLEEAHKIAVDIAGCVPDTVRIYKSLVDRGLASTLGQGLEMEQREMGAANKDVGGGTIAQRRAAVQERGKTQL